VLLDKPATASERDFLKAVRPEVVRAVLTDKWLSDAGAETVRNATEVDYFWKRLRYPNKDVQHYSNEHKKPGQRHTGWKNYEADSWIPKRLEPHSKIPQWLRINFNISTSNRLRKSLIENSLKHTVHFWRTEKQNQKIWWSWIQWIIYW